MAGAELRSTSEEPPVPGASPGGTTVNAGSTTWHLPMGTRCGQAMTPKLMEGLDFQASSSQVSGLCSRAQTHEFHLCCTLLG